MDKQRSFEGDMMDFILHTLADEKAEALYTLPNNITSAYYVMELFKNNVKKHPFIFKLFFKIM